MFYPRLGALRAFLETIPDQLRKLDHPTAFSEQEISTSSNFFYFKTIGQARFSLALTGFLTGRLRLNLRPKEFEYYYTAFQNSSLCADVTDKLGLLGKIRIGAAYQSHLTRGELNILKKEYYFALLALLMELGEQRRARLLCDGYFINHLFGITFPSGIRRSVKEWCCAVAEARYGEGCIRESIKSEGTSQHFRLLINNNETLYLSGSSIKTLRSKAYKALLVRLLEMLDEPPSTGSGPEIIRIRSGELLPEELLESLDMTPWGDDRVDSDELEVELHLTPRQKREWLPE